MPGGIPVDRRWLRQTIFLTQKLKYRRLRVIQKFQSKLVESLGVSNDSPVRNRIARPLGVKKRGGGITHYNIFQVEVLALIGRVATPPERK